MSKHKRFMKEKGPILLLLIRSIPYGEILTVLAEVVFIICAGTLLNYELGSYRQKEMEEKLSHFIVQVEEDALEQEDGLISNTINEAEGAIDSEEDEVLSNVAGTNLEGEKYNPNLSDEQIREYLTRQKEIQEELEKLYSMIEAYQNSYAPETLRIVTGGAFKVIHSDGDESYKSREDELYEQIQSLEDELKTVEATLYNLDLVVHNIGEDEATSKTREIQKAAFRKYQVLIDLNQDFYGWLTIDGTNIDLPVVTASDNNYYLTHDFYQEDSKYGTLFLDYESDISRPSRNLIIYGHNMSDGSMFHDLLAYKDEAFYEEHKTFRFDTIYGEETYEVVAAFYSEVYNKEDEVFKYYKYTNPTKSQMSEFLEQIQKLSRYDTGVEASKEDLYVTLSTCAYHKKNGRFVVIGRKIEENKD